MKIRVLKYTILAGFIYWFWDAPWLWPAIAMAMAAGLGLHFWVRHKTNGWRKSYKGWTYFKSRYEK